MDYIVPAEAPLLCNASGAGQVTNLKSLRRGFIDIKKRQRVRFTTDERPKQGMHTIADIIMSSELQ